LAAVVTVGLVAHKAGGKAVVAEAEVVGSEASASNASNGLKLNKQLASEAQLSESGTELAGPNSKTPLRKADALANEFGGDPSDWVKKGSSSYKASDGTKFETHWEENLKTGQRVNQKTKLN